MTTLALNPKTIIKELNLTENAANEAMNERPKAKDNELDIHQQNVVDHVRKEIEISRSTTQEELNRLDTFRESIEQEIERFSLNHILESAKHKIVRLHHKYRELLEKAKQEEGAVLRNYKFFLYNNKLKREASYPSSKVFHWSLIVVAILIESVMNCFFFAGAGNLGLLGGFFQSLVISMVNVVSAVLIGIYILPYKNHVDTKKVNRTKALVTIYFIFAFLLNLAVAHYRTLIEENPLTAKINTLPHMLNNPFGIDIEAVLLLVIGMIFVIVSMLKGYTADDVYPDYGKMHREFMNASDHRGLRLDAMKSINEIIDEHSRQTTNSAQGSKYKIKDYKNSIFQSEEVVSRFSKEVESAENVCNNALWKYRDVNLVVRSSKPPAYFSQRYSFDDSQIDIDLSEAKSNVNRLESILNQVKDKEEERIQGELRKINETALADIAEYFEKTTETNISYERTDK